MSGPYESAADAHVDAANVYETARSSNERGIAARINNERLLAALTEARVTAGAYDRRILAWLAGWEPEVGQVVIGWVERAHCAGRHSVSEDVTMLRALALRACAYIEPCPPPYVVNGIGSCPHGSWPCPQTELAWELRGLDAEAERNRAFAGMRHQLAAMDEQARP